MPTSPIQIRHLSDDNRVFIDMADGPDNPCTACGACCAHFRVSFYCGELDEGSGGVVPAELAVKVNGVIACMKGTESGGGRCVALEGDIGKGGVRCCIYAKRPTPFREFPAWLEDGTPNPDCQRARAKFGLPPLSSVSTVEV